MTWRVRGLQMGLILIGMVAVSLTPARAFETGSPLTFTVDPATVRQKENKEFSRVTATVTLKDPSPGYFVCIIRGQDEDKINFPGIIFRKGDRKASVVGTVHWKLVRREIRLRLAAYNADAPDRRLTFTVALVPAGSEGARP